MLVVAPGVKPAYGTSGTQPASQKSISSNANKRQLLQSSAEPQIITPSPLGSASTILLGIDFGEKVTATDPNSLFALSCSNCPPGTTGDGTSKVDTLLDVNKGILYISIQVENPEAAAVLQVTVPPGVTTNTAGQPNAGTAPSPLSYMPASSGAAAVGNSMGTMFQAAWPASIVASAAGAANPSVVADISNRALMTTLIGSIALPSMPPIYSTFSSSAGLSNIDSAIGSSKSTTEKEAARDDAQAAVDNLDNFFEANNIAPGKPLAVVVANDGSTTAIPQDLLEQLVNAPANAPLPDAVASAVAAATAAAADPAAAAAADSAAAAGVVPPGETVPEAPLADQLPTTTDPLTQATPEATPAVDNTIASQTPAQAAAAADQIGQPAAAGAATEAAPGQTGTPDAAGTTPSDGSLSPNADPLAPGNEGADYGGDGADDYGGGDEPGDSLSPGNDASPGADEDYNGGDDEDADEDYNGGADEDADEVSPPLGDEDGDDDGDDAYSGGDDEDGDDAYSGGDDDGGDSYGGGGGADFGSYSGGGSAGGYGDGYGARPNYGGGRYDDDDDDDVAPPNDEQSSPDNEFSSPSPDQSSPDSPDPSSPDPSSPDPSSPDPSSPDPSSPDPSSPDPSSPDPSSPDPSSPDPSSPDPSSPDPSSPDPSSPDPSSPDPSSPDPSSPDPSSPDPSSPDPSSPDPSSPDPSSPDPSSPDPSSPDPSSPDPSSPDPSSPDPSSPDPSSPDPSSPDPSSPDPSSPITSPDPNNNSIPDTRRRRRRTLKAAVLAPSPAVVAPRLPAPAPKRAVAPAPTLAVAPAPVPAAAENSAAPNPNVYIVASSGGPPKDGSAATPPAPAPELTGAEALKAEIGADLEALKNQFQSAVMPIRIKNISTAGLWNALMLAGICIGAVVVLHILLRAAVIWRKIRMPEFLLWPAPELMIVGAFIPLVVAAAAPLLAGSGSILALGIIFGVLLPVFYMGWIVWLVVTRITNHDVSHRSAFFVLDDTTLNEIKEKHEKKVSASRQASLTLEEQHEEGVEAQIAVEEPVQIKKNVFRRFGSWLWHGVSVGFFFLLRVLFGYGSIIPGHWVPADIHSESFVGRYGVVFSSTRGPQTLRVQPTYEWDASSNKIDRGSVQKAGKKLLRSGIYADNEHFSRMKSFANKQSTSSTSEESNSGPGSSSSADLDAVHVNTSRFRSKCARTCCVPKTMRVSPALQHTADILRALASAIAIAKMVLAANIMAGLSGNTSVDPKVQVILMLILTVLDFLYVRFLCPVTDPWELIPRTLSLCCDIGTFVCTLLLAIVPTTDIETIGTLGWCMLIFQLSSFLLNALPPCVWLCVGFYGAVVKIIKGKTAADEFVAVVKAAMKADPNILARKYADKWMAKTFGRGLLGRRLMHFEMPTRALPFNPATPVLALSRGVFVTREQIKKLKVLNRSQSIHRGDASDFTLANSQNIDEDGKLVSATKSTNGIFKSAPSSEDAHEQAAIEKSFSIDIGDQIDATMVDRVEEPCERTDTEDRRSVDDDGEEEDVAQPKRNWWLP